jgi:hypothetical protein
MCSFLVKLLKLKGFLFEGGDDCAVVDHRDGEDEQMSGTNIPWSVIG